MHLFEPSRKGKAIGDSRAECDEIQDGGDAMDAGELSGEGLHFLRVWGGIPASLAIFGLCKR